MKEHIDTIPVNEAFDSGDECPFCYLERKAEQSTIRFTAGPSASYMEPEIREITNAMGFCSEHMKKLYDYGNALGVALILQTRFEELLEELQKERGGFQTPARRSIFSRKRVETEEDYFHRLEGKCDSCYICDRMSYHMDRYYLTFFYLLREPEFREKLTNSKGFCLRHFAQLMERAEDRVSGAQREWFYSTVWQVMEDNLLRVKEDLDWLIAKYDYRNAGADWKTSRDALQRTIQKLSGIHPSDPPYKNE